MTVFGSVLYILSSLAFYVFGGAVVYEMYRTYKTHGELRVTKVMVRAIEVAMIGHLFLSKYVTVDNVMNVGTHFLLVLYIVFGATVLYMEYKRVGKFA